MHRGLQEFGGDIETSFKEDGLSVSVLTYWEKNVYQPKRPGRGERMEHDFSDDLLKWALGYGVEHCTFACFPWNNTICEKQDSLIDLKYYYDRADRIVKGGPRLLLSNKLLLKTEADGSSFPSGGLRVTHAARAYTVRDPLSDIFIRNNNKLMYIPSLLVSHYGDALDDKGIFRKSEFVLKKTATALLEKLGKKPRDILLNLGLEQEFFIVPKHDFENRPDLRFCGRTLLGVVGAKNQQFSDHYYAKMPNEIQKIFWEVEKQLLQIGVALKTKHCEVALNQYEFAPIFCDAGKAIDQNLIAMQILKQTFAKGGYEVLFHEKPFLQLNGSGKHANWSIGYVDSNGAIKNLFSPPQEKDPKKQEEEVRLFRLFILLTLSALKNHSVLYFGAVSPPGNEIRLGGHEAPPRIISAFLGSTVGDIIDGKKPKEPESLKNNMPFLFQDVYQEDTDRNRTSSFPYAGHRFEFRALGSSQNAAWPMAVIAATLSSEFQKVIKQLEEGKNIDDIINQLHKDTQAVRYDGNGYSQEWAAEAKKRGLYVNESWPDILNRLHDAVKVFVDIGACREQEIQAKVNCQKDLYCKIVETEGRALLRMAHQKIIPRAIKYLHTLEYAEKSEHQYIKNYASQFNNVLNDSLEALEKLRDDVHALDDLNEAHRIRTNIGGIGKNLAKLCNRLEKDPNFPDLEDFLVK